MTSMKISRVSFVLVFVFALFCAASAVQAADDAKIRVACVGDSITFGAGVANRGVNAYPVKLGEMLGDGYEVKNFGRSGATMLKQGDLPYWRVPQFNQSTEFSPNIVVIKLGTNDTKPQNWKFADEYAKDYEAMIDHFAALESKPTIYLCSPVPVYKDRWGINEKTVVEEVIPKVTELAKRRCLKVIDLYTALTGIPEMFPDGVHPNAAGAKVLAEAVYKAIKK